MRQHYRAKDFPVDYPRRDFTTIEDFCQAVSAINVPHALIDRKVYECLARDFEQIQDRVTMATAKQRETGFLCFFGTTMIFTDAFLLPEQRWVNNEPWDDDGRPQFMVIPASQIKIYQLEYETLP